MNTARVASVSRETPIFQAANDDAGEVLERESASTLDITASPMWWDGRGEGLPATEGRRTPRTLGAVPMSHKSNLTLSEADTEQEPERSGALISAQDAAERRLAESSPPPIPATRDDGPLMAAIQRAASDPNFDVEKLRALREIQRDWNAEQAKIGYDEALARAQAAMPIVKKNKHVYFKPDGKAPTDYWHADYGALANAIKPALTAEGFSWDHKIVQDVTGDGHKITVTCILKRSGHSETVTMFGPPEGSPGMNMLQKIKSTTTYLKRATLEAVSGAATEDDDDDGKGASGGRKAPAPGTPAKVDQMFPIEHPDSAAMDSWKEWGKRQNEKIQQAETQAELAAIWDDNKDAFANCEGSAPKIHARLVKRTEDRAAELAEPAPHEVLGAG